LTLPIELSNHVGDSRSKLQPNNNQSNRRRRKDVEEDSKEQSERSDSPPSSFKGNQSAPNLTASVYRNDDNDNNSNNNSNNDNNNDQVSNDVKVENDETNDGSCNGVRRAPKLSALRATANGFSRPLVMTR
jgi:hypothetical protein